MIKPILVLFLGPSGAGKSKLAKSLASAAGRLRLSADQLRGSLQVYDATNIQHQTLRNALFFQTLQLFLATPRFDIFCEIPRSMLCSVAEIITLGRKHGFDVRLVYLDANDTVLNQRFEEKKKAAVEGGYTLAISDFDQIITNRKETRRCIADIKAIEEQYTGERKLPVLTIDTGLVNMETSISQVTVFTARQ
jgi:predicted kinase